MKLLNFRARGFIGFKRGLGLDEVSIDFSNVSGLTVLDGINGSSKSTCLELLAPFPRLASREGSFTHHTFLRDSERELTFSFGGHLYRTLIKIDCESEKQEGYVWKDGVSEVDGKISSYTKYIKDLLGSPELFYSSVFCGQNAKKLSDMTTGKLKELFAEFLRLDRLQDYESTCKQVGAVLSGKASPLDARITCLQENVGMKEAKELEYGAAGDRAAFKRDAKTELLHDLEEHRKAADALKEVIAQNAAQLARKADLQRSIDRMTVDLSKEKSAAEGEIEALKAKYRELTAEIGKADAVLRDREKIEKASIERNIIETRMIGIQAKIDAESIILPINQQKVHGLETQIAGLRQKVKDLDNDPEIAALDRELHRITGQLGNKFDMTKALGDRDPACVSETCSFIVGALKAEKEIPELEFKKRDIEGTLASRKKAILADKLITGTEIDLATHDLRNAQTVVVGNADLLKTTQADIAKDRATLETLKALSARAPEIAIAEARKADLEKQQAEVEADGKQKRGKLTEKETSFKKELAVLVFQQKDISDQMDFDADAKLKALAAEIKDIETVKLPAIEAEIQAARDKIAQTQAELARIADAEKELTAARADKQALSQEVSEWAYLRNAVSKNGLQALEIDGAAPLITSKANELLSMAFGPLFTVKFRTQDEEGREVLDIIVIGEDGEEVLLDNLSGGQKVWILKALRLAMTLLSKEKSGRVFETFFSDEEDGALDVENARSFIALYQAFMQAGGFLSGFYISHKPECRALAENVLMFTPGKNPEWR